nr:MAG TPA: hypothetical protein [Caudoviricetes sp.]
MITRHIVHPIRQTEGVKKCLISSSICFPSCR